MIRKLFLFLAFTPIIVSCHQNIKESFKTEQKTFVKSINDFFSINEKTIDYANDNKPENLKQAFELANSIKQIIVSSDSISDEYLDFVHPELKAQYRENYINSFRQLLSNITPTPDMNKAFELDQKLKSFAEFIVQNEKNFNDKFEKVERKNNFIIKIQKIISTDESDKKSFWRMIGRFLIANFLSILIFSFYLSGLFLLTYPLLALSQKLRSGFSTIISFLTILILGLVQIYFWSNWAAYLSTNVQFYINSPFVKHSWIYYVAGFFAVGGPLGWLSNKESQTAQNPEETKNIQSGTVYYSLISFAAFIIFCIWPNLMNFKAISIVLDIFK
jgi:hypothetical protein